MFRNLVLSAIFLCLAGASIAQAPQALNYQAVARDGTAATCWSTKTPAYATRTRRQCRRHGHLFGNTFGHDQPVRSVHRQRWKRNTGERHLASIDWSTGPKFLQVELDLGSGYTDMGTSQLLSVPYALFCRQRQHRSAGSGWPARSCRRNGPQGPTGRKVQRELPDHKVPLALQVRKVPPARPARRTCRLGEHFRQYEQGH